MRARPASDYTQHLHVSLGSAESEQEPHPPSQTSFVSSPFDAPLSRPQHRQETDLRGGGSERPVREEVECRSVPVAEGRFPSGGSVGPGRRSVIQT